MAAKKYGGGGGSRGEREKPRLEILWIHAKVEIDLTAEMPNS